MAYYFLQQIAYAAPVLVIYLITIGLAVFFLRRHPLPSMLALAGAVILALTSVGVIISQGTIFRMRMESQWTVSYYNQLLMIVNALAAMFRAVGTILLVGAIFVGRKNRATSEAV